MSCSIKSKLDVEKNAEKKAKRTVLKVKTAEKIDFDQKDFLYFPFEIFSDDEAIYNEKLVRLAYEVAELTVLKEKHRRVEEILAQSNDRKLSKATIEVR